MNNKEKKLISVISPCFNEEENLKEHFKRISSVLSSLKNKYNYEVIYSDNHSEDNSFEILRKLTREYSYVKVIRMARNAGAENSVLTALTHAKGDATIIIQSDLQDPPELISSFIQKWEEGHDIVLGVIEKRGEKNFILNFFRKLYYKILDLFSEVKIQEGAGEFRLLSKRALSALLEYPEKEMLIRGIIPLIGFNQIQVPYDRTPRVAGKSSTNLLYLLSYAIHSLTATSLVPLRLVSVIGFFTFIIGIFMIIFLIITKLIMPDIAPKGITTVLIFISFFSGLIIFSLGIIGEYIRKIYIQSLHRPRAIIQEMINF